MAAEAVWPEIAAETFASGMAAEADGALMAAEARESGGAGGAGQERLARPDEFGTFSHGRPAAGWGGRVGGYRSRHRLGDPIPGSAPWDDVSPDAGYQGGAFPGWGPARGAQPELMFPDDEFSDYTFRSARRPEVRRLPRHAAPSAGFGSRITGLGSRMSGLFAARTLASGARG
jgi:hypothetical protein